LRANIDSGTTRQPLCLTHHTANTLSKSVSVIWVDCC